MASKDPLKKLMRQFPAPAELEQMLETLGQGDDRTIAIVGASVLEAILERFIQRRLAFCDSTLAGQLFYNRGPLSDFHGKIIVAQACGYITTPMAKELLLVKSIRNAFAHAVVGISFDTPEVRTKLDESIMLAAMLNATSSDGRREPVATGAKAFALIVRILTIIIDSNHQEAGGDPFTVKMHPSPPADLPGSATVDDPDGYAVKHSDERE
jgi:hypothetical protein